MDDCVFCDIAAGLAPASLVYRDELVTAFLDRGPVTPGHLLVIPNSHLVYLADLDDLICSRIFSIGLRLAAALRTSELPCEGVNLFLADGEAAGQEVFHAHLHVFARTTGDGFHISAAAWSKPRPSREDLDANASLIRAALGVTASGEAT